MISQRLSDAIDCTFSNIKRSATIQDPEKRYSFLLRRNKFGFGLEHYRDREEAKFKKVNLWCLEKLLE